MTYLIQCAWCGELLGTKTIEQEDRDLGAHPVSHSICPLCRRLVMADTDVSQGHSFSPAMVKQKI